MQVEIFCCYAHKDQYLLDELKTHLKPLRRQGLISIWNDTDISPGTIWEEEIHFPRYQFQQGLDREAFQTALLTLLRYLPYPFPRDAPTALSSHTGERSTPLKKATPRRVGERAPERDPVGEMPVNLASSTCPFKGVIEISPAQMKESGVRRVECPQCATTRSLNGDGPTSKFPSHPKRKTYTPHIMYGGSNVEASGNCPKRACS